MQDPSAALQRAYETLAATYEANRGQFDLSAILADLIARLPERGRLLDLGCGTGEPVARAFLDRNWSVVGVDFCAAMLELAARHCPEMERIQADMRSLDFAPGQFDAITLVYSLFHVPWPEHPALFARFYDWLKPNGLLLFTYATADYTDQERFAGFKTFMDQELPYSHTTPAGLFDQLSDAGFAIEKAETHDIGGERFLWVLARA
ncbi:methyltransferase domain-containing protein [Caldichromatium japonicum]|uniref:Methyltransferase domain-containing protein n=1 Tax=Caldichromatium japonicum TaxID=2699430 RepID=A0A6G7VFT2_9GAMM|nr:class I SAM-dependent methyltransferase [Caldichromatium japonicum]QIK38844.1 methyltransferase domain-containing protein [Caldichromatium japonicum]